MASDKQVETFTAANSSLQEKLSKLTARVSHAAHIDKRAADLETDLVSKEAQLERAQAEHKALKGQLDELQRQLKKKKGKEAETEQAKEMAEALRREKTELVDANNAFQNRLQRMYEQLTDLESRDEDAEKGQRAQCDYYAAQLYVAQTELAAATGPLTQRIAELEHELREEQEEWTRGSAEKEFEMGRLKEAVNSLRKQCTKLAEANTEFADSLEGERKKRQAAERDATENSAKLEEAQSANHKLTADTAEAKHQHENEMSAALSLKLQEISTLKIERDSLESKFQSVSNEMAKLEAAVVSQKQAQEQHQRQLGGGMSAVLPAYSGVGSLFHSTGDDEGAAARGGLLDAVGAGRGRYSMVAEFNSMIGVSAESAQLAILRADLDEINKLKNEYEKECDRLAKQNETARLLELQRAEQLEKLEFYEQRFLRATECIGALTDELEEQREVTLMFKTQVADLAKQLAETTQVADLAKQLAETSSGADVP